MDQRVRRCVPPVARYGQLDRDIDTPAITECHLDDSCLGACRDLLRGCAR